MAFKWINDIVNRVPNIILLNQIVKISNYIY